MESPSTAAPLASLVEPTDRRRPPPPPILEPIGVGGWWAKHWQAVRRWIGWGWMVKRPPASAGDPPGTPSYRGRGGAQLRLSADLFYEVARPPSREPQSTGNRGYPAGIATLCRGAWRGLGGADRNGEALREPSRMAATSGLPSWQFAKAGLKPPKRQVV